MTLPIRSIPSREIVPGVDLVFLDSVHRIVELRPSRHPEFGDHVIAIDATGWGISVYPGSPVQEIRELPAGDDVDDQATDDRASDDLPDWATGATAPAETKTKAKPKPKSVVEILRESAEASGMTGPATAPQNERLTALIGRDSGLDFNLDVIPVLWAAFGADFAPKDMTAAQANAIASLADSLESATPPIDFAEAWKAAAA